MHITCFHLVVTPLVCIHQEWWVFEHQVCVVQQSICIGAAVLSHFCPLPNHLLIANRLLVVVCTMGCVCVLGWLVCVG